MKKMFHEPHLRMIKMETKDVICASGESGIKTMHISSTSVSGTSALSKSRGTEVSDDSW